MIRPIVLVVFDTYLQYILTVKNEAGEQDMLTVRLSRLSQFQDINIRLERHLIRRLKKSYKIKCRFIPDDEIIGSDRPFIYAAKIEQETFDSELEVEWISLKDVTLLNEYHQEIIKRVREAIKR